MSGPVILTLYVLSGACLYGAANHLFGAFRPPFNPTRLVFAGICILLAAFGVTHVLAYEAATVPEYLSALRWNIGAVFALFMLFPWFIADYTGIRPRWLLVASTGAFALLLAANVFAPHTIQFTAAPAVETITLPWGEVLTRGAGPTGVFFLAGSGLVLANLAFGIHALARAWQKGREWTTMAMLCAVVLSLVVSVEGILVRADVIDFVHLGPFGFALMVLTLSLALDHESHGRAHDANSAWEKLWGTPKAAVRGYNILQDEQLVELGVMPYMERAFSGRATEIPPILYDPSKNPQVTVPGRARWVRAFAYPIKDETGTVVEVILMHEDVTAKKHMEDSIRLIAAGVASKTGDEFFQQLVISLAELFDARHAFIGILDPDSSERITTIAVCSDGVIGEDMTYDLAGTPCENVTGKVTCAYTSGMQEKFPEDELLKEMGAESYVGTPLFDARGQPLGLLTVIDDKPLKQDDQIREILEIFASRASAELQRLDAEAHIGRMAYEDYLTGLASRASLHERLAGQLHRTRVSNRSGALILIDLDHFKTINDALGRDVGDEVLRAVSRRLVGAVGRGGFLARVGGDEFVALVGGACDGLEVAESQGSELAERIMGELSRPVFVGDRAFSVGASIGVTVFPREGQDELDIMRHAGMALNQAKSLGRGRIQVYVPSMQAAVTNRLRLEEGLRTAVANRELELHFQPQVNERSEMVGAEALLRWNHPDLGEVMPDQFIPVAEETGLIHEIGAWVIEEACNCLNRWLEDGIAFRGRLSCNASAWQFTSPDFVPGIERILDASGVDAHHLVLELTESALLYDIEETIDKLNRLRNLGFKVALDDFGTGYSSLAYLRDLPLDQLKIDKAFVSELRSEVEQPLVASMIAIGRHMKLAVIAEGVETEDQHQRLREMGCRIYQGYYFGKPQPKRNFLDWIARNRAAINQQSAS